MRHSWHGCETVRHGVGEFHSHRCELGRCLRRLVGGVELLYLRRILQTVLLLLLLRRLITVWRRRSCRLITHFPASKERPHIVPERTMLQHTSTWFRGDVVTWRREHAKCFRRDVRAVVVFTGSFEDDLLGPSRGRDDVLIVKGVAGVVIVALRHGRLDSVRGRAIVVGAWSVSRGWLSSLSLGVRKGGIGVLDRKAALFAGFAIFERIAGGEASVKNRRLTTVVSILAFEGQLFGTTSLLDVVDDDRVNAAHEEGKGEDDTNGSSCNGFVIHAPTGRPAIPLF